MLVLGKNYMTQTSSNMVIVGVIENKKLKMIENEKIIEKFPNNGRAYVPPMYKEVTTGNFKFYKLEHIPTYDRDNSNSSYYTVTNLKTDYPLIEIIDLKESYKTDKNQIIKKIQSGFINIVEPIPEIMLRTSDDYLIGPFKCSYDSQVQSINITSEFQLDKYFINIYDNSKQHVAIEFYYDLHDKVERAFTIQHPEEDNIIDSLDIASDEYIVMDAINFLRGNEKFGDITRRARRDINDWLQSITFSEDRNVLRLEKALELIKQISPQDMNYNTYLEEIRRLDLFQKNLRIDTDEMFLVEYEKFKKENSTLLKENTKLKTENKQSHIKLKEGRKELKETKKAIDTYIDFMKERKNKIEQEFLEYYVQNLTSYHLKAENQAQVSTKMYSESLIKEDSFEVFKDVEDLRRVFKDNLKLVDERDTGNQIFDYILLALKFNQPLFIIGEGSFKLAEIILKTFSSSNSKRVMPASDFSINHLQEIIQDEVENIMFTHIPNIEVSSVSLNISSFVKEYELNNRNNKIIFTFHSLEENKFILDELTNYLILDVSSKPFFSSPFQESSEYILGQLDKKIINQQTNPSIDFEESLEQIDELEYIEELEEKWSNVLKKITYVNQIIEMPIKTMNYFPLIIYELLGDENEL